MDNKKDCSIVIRIRKDKRELASSILRSENNTLSNFIRLSLDELIEKNKDKTLRFYNEK